MRFRKLRWATVWLPVAFIILLEVVEDFILEPALGRWIGHLVTFGLVGIGAIFLSFFVFRTVEQAERRLRRQNRDLAAINEISRVVSGSLELDEILARALEKVLEVAETEAGEIFLLDDSSQELVFRMHRGLFSEAFQEITRFPVGEGFPGLVALSGEPIVVTDIASDERFQRREVVNVGIRAMASVPLRAKDRVVGVMNVADRLKTYTFDELSLLTAIGNQIGLAVENAGLHKQTEETLGHLDAVIESSGDAIITTDMEGTIRTWNQGAEHIYGWMAEEAIGRFLPMVPEQLQEHVAELLARLRAGDTILNLETQRLHKSGRLLTVVVTASPVRDASGKIIGFAGISKDLSEKKHLEAEIARQRQSLAVMEERERIAREMHDGLAQVLGYVNLKAQAVQRFLAVGKSEAAREQVRQLQTAAREVYSDVREAILGLRTSLDGELGLRGAIEEYLESFQEQSGVRTEFSIMDAPALEDLPSPVEVQLIRLIQEALTNVRKHAKASTAWVRVDRVDNQVRVIIEDDGGGFDQAALDRDGWPRFGLQMMRERAEGVGGALEVDSMPGKGTQVRVTLPLETPRETE
ncbi:MAG: GAF domain-containing protein [Anaerolineales bacterium]